MMTPNPLPEPGWWLVMSDGSLYEVVDPQAFDDADPEQTGPAATAEGVYYLAVDAGEVIWTPWADDSVDSVWPTEAEAEVRGDAIEAEWSDDYADGLTSVPPPLDREARYAVTIRHRQGGDPFTPAMLAALSELLTASLSAAGIRATVAVAPMPEEA